MTRAFQLTSGTALGPLVAYKVNSCCLQERTTINMQYKCYYGHTVSTIALSAAGVLDVLELLQMLKFNIRSSLWSVQCRTWTACSAL